MTLNLAPILYALLFFLLYEFLGCGLALLALPRPWRKWLLLVAPLAGYVFMALCSWYFYLAGFPGSDSYYGWIMLAAGLLLLAALAGRGGREALREACNGEVLRILTTAFVVLLLVALPLLVQPHLTSMTLTNNDLPLYALANKIMQIEARGQHHAPYFHFDIHNEFGAYIALPFFCSLTGLEPGQAQMIGILGFLLFTLLLSGFLAVELLGLPSAWLPALLALTGLHSITLYVVYQGFVRQIMAAPLLLLLITVQAALMRCENRRAMLRYLPLLASGLLGLILTYNHVLVLLYALTGFAALVWTLIRRSWSGLLDWAGCNLAALALVLALSPQWLPMLIKNTFYISSVRGGWFMPWLSPDKSLGLYPLLAKSNLAVAIAAALALAALLVLGLARLFRQDRQRFVWSLAVSLLLIPGALTLALLNAVSRPDEGFGGYNQFKLVSLFLPLLIGVVLLFCTAFPARKIRRLTAVFALFGFAVSSGVTLLSFLRSASAVSAATQELAGVPAAGRVSSVNIPAEGASPLAYWNIMWEAYYLYPLPVFFEQDTYYAKTPLNGAWWLERQSPSGDSILTVNPVPGVAGCIRVNPAYCLRRRENVLRLSFGDGWSTPEPGHRWTKEISAWLLIEAGSDGVQAELALDYHALDPRNRLQIYLNDSLCGQGGQDGTRLSLCLKRGLNRLELRALLPPREAGAGDRRRLGYAFRSVVLSGHAKNRNLSAIDNERALR